MADTINIMGRAIRRLANNHYDMGRMHVLFLDADRRAIDFDEFDSQQGTIIVRLGPRLGANRAEAIGLAEQCRAWIVTNMAAADVQIVQ